MISSTYGSLEKVANQKREYISTIDLKRYSEKIICFTVFYSGLLEEV